MLLGGIKIPWWDLPKKNPSQQQRVFTVTTIDKIKSK